jgi:hypothetical protein
MVGQSARRGEQFSAMNTPTLSDRERFLKRFSPVLGDLDEALEDGARVDGQVSKNAQNQQ